MSLSPNTRAWLEGIFAAVISGAASSAVAWLSMSGAKAAGVDVPVLNFKALGIVLLSAAVLNLFLYLKQSPLPSKTETTTLTVTKEVSNSPPGS